MCVGCWIPGSQAPEGEAGDADHADLLPAVLAGSQCPTAGGAALPGQEPRQACAPLCQLQWQHCSGEGDQHFGPGPRGCWGCSQSQGGRGREEGRLEDNTCLWCESFLWRLKGCHGELLVWENVFLFVLFLKRKCVIQLENTESYFVSLCMSFQVQLWFLVTWTLCIIIIVDTVHHGYTVRERNCIISDGSKWKMCVCRTL